MKPVYLDYNATTPIDPAVADAMLPFLRDDFGNPSSGHYYGYRTRAAVEIARLQIASLLGCDADEVIFTSGGTESNNYAIRGYAFANRHRGRHIITSQIEHPAVLEVCSYLEKHCFDITRLPVDEFGMVNPSAVDDAIRDDTILVTIMLANNEVGTIQPIAEIAEILTDRQIGFHTDAAQAVGKIATRVNDLGVDMLSIAGHKLYAPKGIGALYVRRGIEIEKFMFGADHESNRRAGTENVLEIVGLGKASELAHENFDSYASSMRRTRDRMQELLLAGFPSMKINGHLEKRLPNTLSVSFPRIEANIIISEAAGVAISAGAACHAESVDISHVLEAMGIPEDIAMGTLRISTGRFTTDNDIEKAFEELSRVVSGLLSGASGSDGTSAKQGEYKLTRYTHGLGCACKLRPQVLESVLSKLPIPDDKNVLVGTENADDAAVYLISDDLAIVQTVDFFTPVVDDPYDFGQVAAANSLSDIYAMGAKPLFALSIVGFPSNRLPQSVLEEILRGAHDKAKEAGICIIGGHTVDDTEPQYGLAVTGSVHPSKIWMNRGARPGDSIILTKPIGIGILSTAAKQGMIDQPSMDEILLHMSTLNKGAADILADYSVHACTDVTGFGLAGHLHEMTRASGVEVELDSSVIPVIGGAREAAVAGAIPGGTVSNMEFMEGKIEWDDSVDRIARTLICDAQTSGGLLIALDSADAPQAVRALQDAEVKYAAIIGKVTGTGAGKIFVK
ncbi:MAG: selenide, water dikinase SelD [Candidatus Zixiibacteriota bacterium]